MFVTEKNTKKYSCINCNYLCSSLSYWNTHISTAKHVKLCQKVPESLQKVPESLQKVTKKI